MAIKNLIGPPVENDDFFGRKKELKNAWELLESGHSLILAAPRRVGKSSFAKELLDNAQDSGWKTMYIDIEAASTEKEFVKLFSAALNESNILKIAEGWLKALFSNVDLSVEAGGVNAKLSWGERKQAVYEDIKKHLNHEENTLIVVDELAIYLNFLLKGDDGVESVTYFLNWLRSLRQIGESKIRWIFCSSIGIDNFTQLHGLTYTINDTSSFTLGAYSEDEARGLLSALAASYKMRFDEGCLDYVLERLGWWLPYFVQAMFHHIINDVEGDLIVRENINRAYEQQVEDKTLSTWDERLKEYGDDQKYARIILKAVCCAAEGVAREGLLDKIYEKTRDIESAEELLIRGIEILKHDGYIIQSEGVFRFRSPLLKDFWRKRFVE